MYKKVNSDMGFVAREEEILNFWKEEDIYKKQVAQSRSEGKENFTIYDGPPTANGKPHIGHILTRAIKDIYPRHRVMKGYNVVFKAGWDTHGLPVELEVEKALGINGKPEIEAYGIEPFIKKCKESVWTYKDEWEQISARVAYWADMEDPYVTYENNYIESEWWALKRFWDQGLLYKGYKIVPYCPRCGTSLSSHEVAQGYKDVTDTSIFVRFKVKAAQDTYLAAWTTTPWTLPSNVALCVNPDEEYVLIEVKEALDQEHSHTDRCDCAHTHAEHAHAHDESHGTEAAKPTKTVRYYMAGVLVPALFGENYKIIERIKGINLEGLEYEPLLPFANETVELSKKKAFYVTSDDYVTMSDGTGIVHIAPAFGEDDARIGRRYDLPLVQLVKEDGTLPEDAQELAGLFVKDADPLIIKKLAAAGLLLRTQKYEHSYPFCWRCDTPLIYYARHSWFIEMTKVRDQLVANNNTVNWIPESIGSGRFGNFLENVVDWGLSRERYWGTPLPVWVCPDCGKRHMIGSIDELKEMSPDCPEDIELHRPYIDQVHVTCPDCGSLMDRVSEVIDCWFDSGAMPFAQWHYPFENKELFETRFPADFISEALDQTRGWFYSLMAIGTGIFEQSPYRNCEVMGLVQDKNGQKMSKHKGNVVDPWNILNSKGADAIRWYFYTNSNPWLPSRYSDDAVAEGQRKFMGTLWNTYAFYIMYAEIDGFNPREHQFDEATMTVMDRWILSRLQSLVLKVDRSLDQYDITTGGRALTDFVDELSNWYVRRNRERYWAGDMTQDKINAYLTLYTVLETIIRLAAPFVPFVTESIYQNLVRSIDPEAKESIHLCAYPAADTALIDKALEANMEDLLKVVVLGRAARNTSAVKNRQPLAEMFVSGLSMNEEFTALALDELNVKACHFITDASELEDYGFKPQLKTLGRRFGKNLPSLSEVLKQLDGRAAMHELKTSGQVVVELDGEKHALTEEDLLIERRQAEGLASASDHGVTVALDLKLTAELIKEGLMRELVSKIQTMRKETDFNVVDRIVVAYKADEELEAVFTSQAEEIKAEVLAAELLQLDDEAIAQAETIKEWNINGHDCTLALRRFH